MMDTEPDPRSRTAQTTLALVALALEHGRKKTMSIIVTRDGRTARRIEPRAIPRETFLQDYVVANPDALPLSELSAGLVLVIVAREFPTGSGPIDAVGIDSDGQVYLIETKLYSNTDKRRVLAQVMDYGAALWRRHGDPRSFREQLEEATRRCHDTGLDTMICDRFGIEQEDAAELLKKVEHVVSEGSFRFVVLMNHMDDALKDLISYINENSRFDVYGVELEFYRFDDYEVTLPKLYGAEARKEVGGSSARARWDEAKYFDDARSRLSSEQVESLERLYRFAVEHADEVKWGTGAGTGSFNLRYERLHPTKSVLTAYSDGDLTFNFKWLHEPEQALPDEARQLAERLNDLEGWILPADYANAYPRLSVEVWASQVDKVIEALRLAVPSLRS